MNQGLQKVGQRIRQRSRIVLSSEGYKPTQTARPMAHTDSSESCGSVLESVNRTMVSRVTNPQGLKFFLTNLLFILGTVVSLAQYPIHYIGSNPVTGSSVDSFENIELEFDLTEVIEGLGGEGQWGMSYNASYNAKLPSKEKSAALYKGSIDDGEVIARLSTRHTATEAGNKIVLTFEDIEIETGQEYNIVVTYEVFATNIETKASNGQTLALKDNPIILTFFGGNNVSKVLKLEECELQGSTQNKLNEVLLSFNYPISITNDSYAEVLESGDVVASTNNFEVDETNNKVLHVTFSDLECYLDHKYTLHIPKNIISIAGEPSYNTELLINFEGSALRYFGLGRGLNPSEDSASVLDEIVVPFKLPQSDSHAYGFSDIGKIGFMHVYYGNEALGEEVLSIQGEASAESNSSILFHPNFAFEPSSEYTFVIPEGDIEVYDLGARNPSVQREFINERIELHYTTPSVEDLPKWTPTPRNIENDEVVADLKYFILDCPEYEYDGTKYNIVFNKNYEGERKDAALYKVTENGDEEIAVFNVTLKTLDANSEIGNGELEGRYFVGEVNESLYEGVEYKLVWFENKFIVNSPFIGKYIGNPEITVMLKGATSVSDDFGLTANVEDRLHSHADVFSFVTESEVKAGEGAKMVLKDGEENVAEAPVYVSREANGHRVYADFGGKKLEAGKSYDVVLPEGSVYATNGIVNNPEIKSTINAMPETPAAPEFISIALNIDEYASATYRMVKGEESVVSLKDSEDWTLQSLKLNDEDVTSEVAENGLYTIPALEADATLEAVYGYAHTIDYDFTTGVESPADAPYSLSKEGSHLIINGLKGGEKIDVFTVGGMKVASLPAVPTGNDRASLLLPEGQVYIILIDNTSIKYKH